MKKVIIYKGKYGTSASIAKRISEECNIKELYEVNEFHKEIKEYDVIVLGTSIYAGEYDKEIKKLWAENESSLKTKQLFFYSCGITQEENCYEKDAEANFGTSFLTAITYGCKVGGVLNFEKMNFMEKGIIKLINKKPKLIEKIDTKKSYSFLREEEILKLIKEINLA